jgi:ferric-dicitrate binding protein FerR (iron transport regulator)
MSTGRVYATTTGQQEIITLQDGTRITLAPQTTVRLVRFTSRERLIALDGEAAFDVAHAGSEPFVVQTGDVSTRVLGTSFVVRHYASDSHVRVAVTDGKVAVASHTAQRPSVVLPAGYVGDVTDSTASSMRVTDMALYTGWLDGHLSFHEAPTPEVLAALSRWYGYEFRLADSTLASRNLTIVLSTRSLTSAFATLKLVLDVDLSVDGHVVTIVPHRTTSMNPSMKTRNYWNNLTPQDKEVGR